MALVSLSFLRFFHCCLFTHNLEILREIGWVIFDEIHYMRDKDRGVVWEETIILLPDTTRFVFLSATIPNAREFSEWISVIHQQPCHVVYLLFSFPSLV